MKSGERQELGAAIEELRAWVSLAEQIRFLASHMPLSGPAQPSPAEVEVVVPLLQLASSGDLQTASALAKVVLFDGRQRFAPAREAAARLLSYRRAFLASGSSVRLTESHSKHVECFSREHEELRHLLSDMDQLARQANQMVRNVAHMPITRSGLLSESGAAAAMSLVDTVAEQHPFALALLEPNVCETGRCAAAHRSVKVLHGFQSRASGDGTLHLVRVRAARIAGQLAAEQREVAALATQAKGWIDQARAIRDLHQRALSAAQVRAAELVERAVPVTIAGIPVRVVSLVDDDRTFVANLRFLTTVVTEADERFLAGTAEQAGSLLEALHKGYNSQWICHGDERCDDAHRIIPDVYARREAIQNQVAVLADRSAEAAGGLDSLSDRDLNLIRYLPGRFRCPEVIPRSLTERADKHLSAIVNAARVAQAAAKRAHEAADTVRAADVAVALKAMDLDVLRKASSESIRTSVLEGHGFRNVFDVLQYDSQHWLSDLEGLGHVSARAISQAALRLHEAVREDTPVRIDVKGRHERTATLLQCLRRWDAVRRFEPTDDETALATSLMSAFKARHPASAVLSIAEGSDGPEPPSLTSLLVSALERVVPELNDTDIWTDFLSRPAEYSAMLNELGFMTEDEAKMHGDLPTEIVEAVRAKELRKEFLTASLRAYQSFGARFALVQEKVVIGDEMGLGKTVEALAVLAHLREIGHSNFLVVCPAAVVSNWVREIHKHTSLRATRWHGPEWERNRAAKAWRRSGGVAVTTYDLLSWAQGHLGGVDVGCAVFDEAHYIKNPLAKRSRAAAELMASLRYAVLMTGTPLENNVQEFRNLIGYIRADLAESAPEYLASRFRRHVAPAYLRRNQEDVLTELPELVEVEEWLALSDVEDGMYRDAVERGSFMLMRRAAMLSPRSLKMERLLAIVAEAKANGRRVIVFSYFREVLSHVVACLPGQVFGPLTGSVPAAERQNLIDRFSAAGDGAVLVAQITAGGVGLNIQSASVVVICEPQLKPTMESQAIARAHRMGQTNTVQVHRLLTENSVDERILEILAVKRELFDEFARDSVIAKEAPDAVDVSDAELARMVVAAERERLFGRTSAMQPSS